MITNKDRSISINWDIDDVKSLDSKITDEQAMEVLEANQDYLQPFKSHALLKENCDH